MDHKSPTKDYILIYPIRHSNTHPKSSRSEKDFANISKILSCKSPELRQPSPKAKEEKKKNFLASVKNLSKIKECKSLSPKVRKDWMNDFISTVSQWEGKNREIQDFEKNQFKIKSSIAEVLRCVNSYRKPHSKGIFNKN